MRVLKTWRRMISMARSMRFLKMCRRIRIGTWSLSVGMGTRVGPKHMAML